VNTLKQLASDDRIIAIFSAQTAAGEEELNREISRVTNGAGFAHDELAQLGRFVTAARPLKRLAENQNPVISHVALTTLASWLEEP
jgi:hypothetical protein